VDAGPSPLPYNDFLQEHFCNLGQHVIVDLNEYKNHNPIPCGHHYVLVTGSTNGNDWTVFDPGWGNAPPTLSGHIAGFTNNQGNFLQFTVYGYHPFQLGGHSSFSANAQSPVALLVVDPMGRRAGFDPITATDYNEISGAGYYQDGPSADAQDDGASIGDPSGISSVYVPFPLSGIYTVLATGTTNGPYTIDLQTAGPGVIGEFVTNSGIASVGVQVTNYLTVAMQPQLSIMLSGANVIVTWPTNATGFTLQSTTNLSPAAWRTNLPAPVVINGQYTVTNPISGTQLFYELTL
jgi:hypothetical protein